MKRNEKDHKRTTVSAAYKATFLHRTDSLASDGKTVYIDEEFHRMVSHIFLLLCEPKMNISDYLYKVLKQHFSVHGRKISNTRTIMSKSIL